MRYLRPTTQTGEEAAAELGSQAERLGLKVSQHRAEHPTHLSLSLDSIDEGALHHTAALKRAAAEEATGAAVMPFCVRCGHKVSAHTNEQCSGAPGCSCHAVLAVPVRWSEEESAPTPARILAGFASAIAEEVEVGAGIKLGSLDLRVAFTQRGHLVLEGRVRARGEVDGVAFARQVSGVAIRAATVDVIYLTSRAIALDIAQRMKRTADHG